MISTANAWLIVGFLGQTFFSMRFLIQWIHSERMRKSLIPVAFWYFSVAGGATLLAYALYRQDPVFIVGQGAGLLVYGRNLYFIFRERRMQRLAAQDGPGDDAPGGGSSLG